MEPSREFPPNTWHKLDDPAWPPAFLKKGDVAVDLLCKRWNPHTDKFEFTRVPDCKWDWSSKTFATTDGDESIPSGMRPVGFMIVEFPAWTKEG